MTTLAERIKNGQSDLIVLKDRLLAATQELEELDEADEGFQAKQAEVEELTTKVESGSRTLDSLKRAEKALHEHTVEADDPAAVRPQGRAPPAGAIAERKSAPVELFVKSAVCQFLAHCRKTTPDAIRSEIYAKDKALEAVFVAKSAVPLATTYQTGWAAELVRDDTRGFLDLLVPTSIAAALATRGYPLNFDGYNSVTIPGRKPRAAGTNNMAAAFVGEGGAIPLGRMDFQAQSLNRYKMGIISTFSRELAERSTPSIEAKVREAILGDTSIALDAAVFGDGAAVAGVMPAGLLNGVVAIPGDTTGGPDSVIADVKAAVSALAAAGMGKGIVLFINELDAVSVALMQNALGEFMFTDVNSGNLLTFSVVVSENVPQHTLWAVSAPNVATAFDAPQFDVSDVATVVEANADTTAPTHAATSAGVIGTAGQVPQGGGIPANVPATGAAFAGATARSLWQTYSIGVRTVFPVSWGALRPGAVAEVSPTDW